MTAPATQTRPAEQPKSDEPTAWNVVLLDDQDHTYDYVIRMCQTVFGHSTQRAFKVAQAVDSRGRAVCLTTHKEHAELKRDQILAFGADPLIPRCQGSMSAVIEPALSPEDGDDGGEHQN